MLGTRTAAAATPSSVRVTMPSFTAAIRIICLASVVGWTVVILTQIPTISVIIQRDLIESPRFEQKWQSNTTAASIYYNDIPARAFPVWNHSKKSFPCVPRRDDPIGNLFIGPSKAASSTMGGIMFRISRNVHNRYHDKNNKLNRADSHSSCRVREQLYMFPANTFGYNKRDPTKSFLWSIIREPTKRFVSEFFHFKVSREKVEPTDANMQQYMSKFSYANYVQLLHPEPGQPGYLTSNLAVSVEEIIQEYDFIGVVERLDESLVVLKLLLGLEMNDILYLKAAKGNGGFDDGGYNNSCVYIMPSFITPGMKEWFETNRQYKQMMSGDNMVYQAAYKSLDLTINALGRELVEKELQEFHKVMKVAQETCTDIIYPCSPGGVKTYPNDCIFSDLACGYKCLDTLAMESSTS
jgi:hypothetical protein